MGQSIVTTQKKIKMNLMRRMMGPYRPTVVLCQKESTDKRINDPCRPFDGVSSSKW
jgi:hypothetical protein